MIGYVNKLLSYWYEKGYFIWVLYVGNLYV